MTSRAQGRWASTPYLYHTSHTKSCQAPDARWPAPPGRQRYHVAEHGNIIKTASNVWLISIPRSRRARSGRAPAPARAEHLGRPIDADHRVARSARRPRAAVPHPRSSTRRTVLAHTSEDPRSAHTPPGSPGRGREVVRGGVVATKTVDPALPERLVDGKADPSIWSSSSPSPRAGTALSSDAFGHRYDSSANRPRLQHRPFACRGRTAAFQPPGGQSAPNSERRVPFLRRQSSRTSSTRFGPRLLDLSSRLPFREPSVYA